MSGQEGLAEKERRFDGERQDGENVDPVAVDAAPSPAKQDATQKAGSAAAVRMAHGGKSPEEYNGEHPGRVAEFLRLTHAESVGGDGRLDVEKVRGWQRRHGLDGDGKVGPLTLTTARGAGKRAAPAQVAGPAGESAPAVETPATPAAPKVANEREAEAPKKETPVPGAASAAPAVAPGPAAVTDTVTTEHKTMLHAEEIFADVPANTDKKKHAFNDYNSALKGVAREERKVADAKSEKARAAAQASLDKAKGKVATTLGTLKDFIVGYKFDHDKKVQSLKAQLKQAKGNAAATAAIKQALEERRAEIVTDVNEMKHHQAGHENESVFAAIDTEVHTHHVHFADGETVVMHDNVASYATTTAEGLDTGEGGAAGKAQVKDKMDNAGLSSSKTKILKEVSGFEGSFDTTQTYDRAVLTWGFVQWTGGKASDLTKTLTIIKQQHAKAFADQFQAYGIDVVDDQLVLTPSGGGKPLQGDEAAKAISTNPTLVAVLAHAGRNQDIQQGQVEAAEKIEISKGLSRTSKAGDHQVAWSKVLTSEYAVGLMANITVHAGSGAAGNCMKAAIADVVAKTPFADDEAWYALVEKAAISHFAHLDGDRAAVLGKKLDKERGSFKA